MTNLPRWKDDLIVLGQLGRKMPIRVERYEQLDSANGIFRPEGSRQMKESKAYVIGKMKEAGLEVRMDQVGNIFGRRGGKETDNGVLMSGSHLDSVINGGMFDGAYGVVSALEAIRIMNDEGFHNERPIEVAIFMGEEGSAFKKGLLGSKVVAGETPVGEALNLRNDAGITLKEILDKDQLRGSFQIDLGEVEFFIETHIEQGPVLYREKTPIGIVENITGITWVNAVLEGAENHAGTTPMSGRRDALVAAADIVQFVNGKAKEMAAMVGGSTVATVGSLLVHPGSVNVIPGKVNIGIDIRDGIEQNMKDLREETVKAIKTLYEKYGVKATIDIPLDTPPCPCSEEMVDVIERVARKTGIKTKRMTSGAGHDAANMAGKVKAGLIFVPSVNGISHSPMEWTDWEDLEKGIELLSRVLKGLSKIE